MFFIRINFLNYIYLTIIFQKKKKHSLLRAQKYFFFFASEGNQVDESAIQKHFSEHFLKLGLSVSKMNAAFWNFRNIFNACFISLN